MNKQITVFSRAAGYAVNKALSPENRAKSADRAQLLINNMNIINQSLMQLAVKMMNKVQNNKEIDRDELATNLHDIIHLSIVSYAKRAY
ncbi:MAG: hypothetical protein H6550_14050 [Chitinophagales bacterium]|nr:hypothetical protein [Chitinophagales bacterium]